MSAAGPKLSALILAGRRPGPPDSLEAAEGVAHKALIDIAGAPMIARVISALRSAPTIGDIAVAAPEELRPALRDAASADGPLRWIDAEGTPATTVEAALAASAADALLVTTCDHPLLAPSMIEEFLAGIGEANGDGAIGAAAGYVSAEVYEARYAGARRTFIRLKDLKFSGANLFWFRRGAAEPLLRFWRTLEAKRKNPAAMAAAIGLPTLIRYAAGALGAADLLATVARRTGVKARLVPLAAAEAAMDVDREVDLDLVRRVFAEKYAR